MLCEAHTETDETCRDALGEIIFAAAHSQEPELDLNGAVTNMVRARGERKGPPPAGTALNPQSCN
jgi:hypothetical protein